MKASDIMTSPVISVSPGTTVGEIAALLSEKRISAVPVVDGGRLVGTVGEGDLLHRREIGTDRPARATGARCNDLGIVSRADLVQAIAAVAHPEQRIHPSNDDGIRGRLLTELEQHSWWRPAPLLQAP